MIRRGEDEGDLVLQSWGRPSRGAACCGGKAGPGRGPAAALPGGLPGHPGHHVLHHLHVLPGAVLPAPGPAGGGPGDAGGGRPGPAGPTACGGRPGPWPPATWRRATGGRGRGRRAGSGGRILASQDVPEGRGAVRRGSPRERSPLIACAVATSWLRGRRGRRSRAGAGAWPTRGGPGGALTTRRWPGWSWGATAACWGAEAAEALSRRLGATLEVQRVEAARAAVSFRS